MDTYSPFDLLHAGSLFIEKKELLKPLFSLGDETKTYADMNYPPTYNYVSAINSAEHLWQLYKTRKGWMELGIRDVATGEQAAVIKTSFWLAKISIEFPDGDVFKFKRPTVFHTKQSWYNNRYGTVLTTRLNPFKMIGKHEILPEINVYKNNDNILLMIFTSVHMVFARKARTGWMQEK